MMTNLRNYAALMGMLAVCGAALCAVPMHAQQGGGMGPERQQAQLDALTQAVGLTPDQVTQVKAINADSMQKMMDVRSSGAAPADMRPKMMAIRTDQQARIKALLTDEQKPKYDAYLAAQPQGRQGGGPPPTSPPPQQ